jgi:hypothetical protein
MVAVFELIVSNQAPFCPLLLLDSRQEKAVGQRKEQTLEHSDFT